MVKGKITLKIIRRIEDPKSRRRKDQYIELDKIELISFLDQSRVKKFRVNSLRAGKPPINITRDELALVKMIKYYYGTGDYSVLMWGKGKNRGHRRFWDGIISPQNQFQRRKEMRFNKDSGASYYERASSAKDTESYIGRYMRTKRPGAWHIL